MVSRSAVAAILAVMLGAPGHAQPCNPAIDGTYCASLPTSRPGNTLSGRTSTLESGYAPSIQSLGGGLSPAFDQPATFGAISFRNDGTRCTGLVRRGSCK
jgi:hypothetical protein